MRGARRFHLTFALRLLRLFRVLTLLAAAPVLLFAFVSQAKPSNIGTLQQLGSKLFGEGESAATNGDTDEYADKIFEATQDEGQEQIAKLAASGLTNLSGTLSESQGVVQQVLGTHAGNVGGYLANITDGSSTITLNLASTAAEAEPQSFIALAQEVAPEAASGLAQGAIGGVVQKVEMDAVVSGVQQDGQNMMSVGARLDSQVNTGDNSLNLSTGVCKFNGGCGGIAAGTYAPVNTDTGISQVTLKQNPGYSTGQEMTNTLENPYSPGLPLGIPGEHNIGFPDRTDSIDPNSGVETVQFSSGGTRTIMPTGVMADDTGQGAQPISKYEDRDANNNVVATGYMSRSFGGVSNCTNGADGSMTCTAVGQTNDDGSPVQVNFDPDMAAKLRQDPPDNSTVVNGGAPDNLQPEGISVTDTIEPEALPVMALAPIDLPAVGTGAANPDSAAAAPAPGPANADAPPSSDAGNAAPSGDLTTSTDPQSGAPAVPAAPAGADCSGITDPGQLKACQAQLAKPTDCIAKQMAAKAGKDVSNFDCGSTDQKLTATQNALTGLNTGLQLDQQNKGDAQLANVAGENSQSNAQIAAQNMTANAQQADTTKGVGSIAAALIATHEGSKHTAAANDPDLVAAANPSSYQTVPGSAPGMVMINPINGMSRVALQSGAGIAPGTQVPVAQVAGVVQRATAYAARARAQENTEAAKARGISSVNVQSAASAVLDASGAAQAGKAAAGVVGNLSGGGGGGNGDSGGGVNGGGGDNNGGGDGTAQGE